MEALKTTKEKVSELIRQKNGRYMLESDGYVQELDETDIRRMLASKELDCKITFTAVDGTGCIAYVEDDEWLLDADYEDEEGHVISFTIPNIIKVADIPKFKAQN